MFGGSSNGRMFVNLKSRRERKATSEQIANRIRPKLLGIPGIRAVVTLPPALRIGGRMSRAAYEVTMQAPDTAMLYSESARFERLMARLPELQEVNSDLQIRNATLEFGSGPRKSSRARARFSANRKRVVLRLRAHLGFHDLRAAESVPSDARS